MSNNQFPIYNGDQEIDLRVHLLKVKRNLIKSTGATNEGVTMFNSDGSINTKIVDKFEVEPGAVLNLEYSESTLRMGIEGVIEVDNTFNILEALDLNNTTQYELYVHIHAQDVELNEAGYDFGHDVLCYVTNLANASSDYVNNTVTFEFEEAFVNALRHISLNQVIYDWTGVERTDPTNNEISEIKPTVPSINAMHLLEFVYNRRYFGAHNPKIQSIMHQDSKNVPINTLHALVALSEGDESTVYDAIVKMMDQSLIGSINNYWHSYEHRAPFIRMAYDPSVGERRMLIAPIVTERHQEMLKVINNRETLAKLSSKNNDYSDVYTEKFAFGPLAGAIAWDPNATFRNSVETYNLTRANINTLKDTTWGNYLINEGNSSYDPAIFNQKLHAFRTILQLYVAREFSGLDYSTNVPILNKEGLKVFKLKKSYLGSPYGYNLANTIPGIDAKTHIYNNAYNKVARSFLTIAETITFESVGMLYRQPNKFVWVEKYGGKEHKKSLQDKIYYVNKVIHRFTKSEYYTEQQVSKWFGETSVEAINAFGEDEFNELKEEQEFDALPLDSPTRREARTLAFKRAARIEALDALRNNILQESSQRKQARQEAIANIQEGIKKEKEERRSNYDKAIEEYKKRRQKIVDESRQARQEQDRILGAAEAKADRVLNGVTTTTEVVAKNDAQGTLYVPIEVNTLPNGDRYYQNESGQMIPYDNSKGIPIYKAKVYERDTE